MNDIFDLGLSDYQHGEHLIQSILDDMCSAIPNKEWFKNLQAVTSYVNSIEKFVTVLWPESEELAITPHIEFHYKDGPFAYWWITKFYDKLCMFSSSYTCNLPYSIKNRKPFIKLPMNHSANVKFLKFIAVNCGYKCEIALTDVASDPEYHHASPLRAKDKNSILQLLESLHYIKQEFRKAGYQKQLKNIDVCLADAFWNYHHFTLPYAIPYLEGKLLEME